MPKTITCSVCNGIGRKEYLVSMHDNATTYDTCYECDGKGVLHMMTEREEENYKKDSLDGSWK